MQRMNSDWVLESKKPPNTGFILDSIILLLILSIIIFYIYYTVYTQENVLIPKEIQREYLGIKHHEYLKLIFKWFRQIYNILTHIYFIFTHIYMKYRKIANIYAFSIGASKYIKLSRHKGETDSNTIQ